MQFRHLAIGTKFTIYGSIEPLKKVSEEEFIELKIQLSKYAPEPQPQKIGRKNIKVMVIE